MKTYEDIQTMDQLSQDDFEGHGSNLTTTFDISADELTAQQWELWSCCAYNEPNLHVLYFPTCGRAGVVHGGDAAWTDADSVQDAIERYFGDDDKEMSN